MAEWGIFTRRRFIRDGLSLIGMGASVPSFLCSTVEALAGPESSVPAGRSSDHRILVVLQMAGGNDGLNTIIPIRQDPYYRARPTLAIKPDKALSLDQELGFHPSAVGLKSLFDDGYLSIVRGVGYPNPNRSHFKSTDIWATGAPDGRQHEGWLGRYFDHECSGQDPIDPKLGLALVQEAPLAMRGSRFLPIAFEKAERLSLQGIGGDPVTAKVIRAFNRPDEDQVSPPSTTLEFLRRTALDAQLSAEEIRTAATTSAGKVSFPGSALGKSLRTIHRMIAGGLPTRVYYASLGGFDTHANQGGRHGGLLADLGKSLRAFVAALKSSGDLDRTLLMTFSEFGRRVQENASRGTDHGAAAPMFLVGSQVHPGLHGQSPSLDRLRDGDLAYTVDFRRVYATVLQDWLKSDPVKILHGRFKTLPLIKG